MTYAPKIDKAEARIDWTRPADEIERQIRAFNPVPGAFFEVQGERVRIHEAQVGGGSGAPGTVINDTLEIACSAGSIIPVKVQRAGRGVMTPGELLRGFAIPAGTAL